MFSGIIKNTGKVHKIYKDKKSLILEISSNIKFKKDEIGSSISCSGTCLTLNNISGKKIKFYLSLETANRTNFKFLLKGSKINLEKSLMHGDRNSGHFVQGHVDTISQVKKIKTVGKSWVVTFSLPSKYMNYIVEKGSIAINGVSLTISKIIGKGFQVVIIPQTLKLTNLIHLKNRDLVNLEFDVIGKYINSFLK